MLVEQSAENADFIKEGNENENSVKTLLTYLNNQSASSSNTSIDPKTCGAEEYVQHFIFPVLLPALHEMLIAAEENLVFERRRTKFNACDFLTEYLYRTNPCFDDRGDVSLLEIPFVQEILKKNPRPPLPLSLIWSEDEAAAVIQSFWRGYVVRKDEEVQELRQYQKDMRESSYHIMFRVEDFWRKHPVEDDSLEEEHDSETAETPLN